MTFPTHKWEITYVAGERPKVLVDGREVPEVVAATVEGGRGEVTKLQLTCRATDEVVVVVTDQGTAHTLRRPTCGD